MVKVPKFATIKFSIAERFLSIFTHRQRLLLFIHPPSV